MTSRSLSDAAVEAAADLLAAHRADRCTLAALPESMRPATKADAYAVQDALVERLCARHDSHRVGYKVACTNVIAQEALKVDSPLFGQMLDHSTWREPAVLPAAAFTTRVIECEFGLRLGADVPVSALPLTAADVAPYVAQVMPSIEIVDHRFVDWSLGALSIAADNAIHGGWVFGEAYPGDWRELDLAAHTIDVRIDGVLVDRGSGSAVLGHPLNVLAWLAGELPRYGHRLRAGDLVTTGVCTDVFSAAAGSAVLADFGAMGTVSLRLT